METIDLKPGNMPLEEHLKKASASFLKLAEKAQTQVTPLNINGAELVVLPKYVWDRLEVFLIFIKAKPEINAMIDQVLGEREDLLCVWRPIPTPGTEEGNLNER